MKLAKIVTYMALFLMIALQTANAATSSIVVDAKSGKVLSSRNADVKKYPASLTKIMTLYMVFDAIEKGKISEDDDLVISRKAANASPSRLAVRAGTKIKVKTAILALIVKSANDVAVAFSERLAGGEKEFAIEMTKTAQELGMTNTKFYNASGLPNRRQKTTARDMALLGLSMYRHFPEYYKLFSIRKFTFDNRTFYTHNKLLRKFEGVDGLKTGFISAVGFNIVTSANRNGRRVFVVTMGHNTADRRDKYVSKLMSKAFIKMAMNPNNIPIPMAKPDSNVMLADVSLDKFLKKDDDTSENWSIQIGAFSNYAKARDYALIIQSQLENEVGFKDVEIMPYQVGHAVVYRSRLTGLEKTYANKACDGLRKLNKSCMLIAPDEIKLDTMVAQR